MNTKQASKELVRVVLDKLNDRKGFYYWWNLIPDEKVKEISAELEEAVAAKLRDCEIPF